MLNKLKSPAVRDSCTAAGRGQLVRKNCRCDGETAKKTILGRGRGYGYFIPVTSL
jgi:hypothetical protein